MDSAWFRCLENVIGDPFSVKLNVFYRIIEVAIPTVGRAVINHALFVIDPFHAGDALGVFLCPFLLPYRFVLFGVGIALLIAAARFFCAIVHSALAMTAAGGGGR